MINLGEVAGISSDKWSIIPEQSLAICRAPTIMNDPQIRAEVKRQLRALYRGDSETVIIDELGLKHGTSRVDLAVVNGSLHGFELKSDGDTLRRLPKQAGVFSSALDYVTLVVANCHAPKAITLVPEWWGIKVAHVQGDGELRLADLRTHRPNPSPDPLAVAKLLWRDEALAFLEELDEAKGLHSKPRREIYVKLVAVSALEQIQSRVRYHLKNRSDWRSGEQRVSCGG